MCNYVLQVIVSLMNVFIHVFKPEFIVCTYCMFVLYLQLFMGFELHFGILGIYFAFILYNHFVNSKFIQYIP